MKNRIVGTCRLCLAQNVELRDSHIISGWAYDRIRKHSALDPLSKNHNPVSVSGDTAVQISNEIKEHMLCGSCEQKFGVHENWFKQITEAPPGALPPLSSLLNPNRMKVNDDYSLARVGQLDLTSFVYFALSTFWRAHECSRVTDFELEPHVAESLRRYLNAGDPLPASLTLTTYFYESTYVERPRIVSAFKTPNTAGGIHVFVIACIIFALAETSDPTDRHLCLLHSPDKVLVIAPTEELAGPLRERVASTESKGKGLLAYRAARAAQKQRTKVP